MPLTARLAAVALTALVLAGCGEQQRHATAPPAAQLPEQAISDAPALIAVPRLRHAPPVRPLPIVRPRVKRAVVHHPAPRIVARTAALPVPVQQPLPRTRSRPASPPIVFDDSG